MTDPDKAPRGLQNVQSISPAFAAAVQTPNGKRAAFDPQNAFGSITAGRQQFTLLADTNHGDPSIVLGIAENVAAMARSGVRHMIIEYPPNDLTQQMIEKLYARPPQVTYDEVRKNSDWFNSSSPPTEATRRESGKAYAEMLINCHKNGIRFHLGGDTLGQEAAERMRELREKQDWLDRTGAMMDPLYQGYQKEGRGYLVKQGLAEKDGPSFVEDALRQYQDKKQTLGNEIDKAQKAAFDEQTEKRMGPAAEDSRAQRFIRTANGEKAVVMFGVDHINHDNDLNEALDRRLQAEALKKGSAFEQTRTIDIYGSRAAERELRDAGLAGKGEAQFFQKEQRGVLTAEGARSFVTMSSPSSPRTESQLQY
ncbi:MAG: hypothetical protein JWO78_1628 [Micavibrio sp.]|nr:hypothetical protein [Micavibrio sp.]